MTHLEATGEVLKSVSMINSPLKITLEVLRSVSTINSLLRLTRKVFKSVSIIYSLLQTTGEALKFCSHGSPASESYREFVKRTTVILVVV